MKNVEMLFDESLEIVKNIVGENNLMKINKPVLINTRATSRWGLCRKRNNIATIEISNRILDDKVPTDAIMSVMIHEILHACKDCKGHTGMWKFYANKINDKFPQYKITRCLSSEEFNLKEEQIELKNKYAIKCLKCGRIHYSSRLSKTIQYPERYRCGCGGKLERII